MLSHRKKQKNNIISEITKKFLSRKKQKNKKMDYVSDPVSEIMNCDQKIIYDSSFQVTKFMCEITNTYGSTSLYNEYRITSRLPDIVDMETMVMSIPIQLKAYFPVNSVASPWYNSELFTNALYADMGVMNAIHQLEIKLNNVSVCKSESDKIRNLKATMVDDKFDDDEYEVIGKWGVPKTQSYTYSKDNQGNAFLNGGNPAWLSNNEAWRTSFLTLLQSIDDRLNGSKETLTIKSNGGDKQMDVYTTTVNLALPLKYINRSFRSGGRLPIGLPISIELQSFNKEQPFGAIPFNKGFLTTFVAGSPKLIYAYDQVKPEIMEIVKDFRLTSYMSYTNDLMEEFNFNSVNSLSLQAAVAVQQQLPTEFIIRSYSEIGYTDNDDSLNWDQTEVPYFMADKVAWFPNSLVNMAVRSNNGEINNNLNKIKNLRFKNSGVSVYDIPLEDDLRNGNFNPSAYDYILNNVMSKKSFLNVGNKLSMLKGPSNNFSSKMINGGYNFIYMPGGKASEGVQPGDTSSFNIVVEIDLEKELAQGITLSILKKIPSMMKIGPENSVRELMWPEIERNDVISVVSPKLAN